MSKKTITPDGGTVIVSRHKSTLVCATVGMALLIAACGTTTGMSTSATAPAPALETLLTSTAGQSLVTNVLNAAVPELNTIIAKGSAATAADLQQAAYWAPWVQSLVDLVGPAAGLSSSDVSGINTVLGDVVTLANGGTGNTAALVSELSTLVTQLQPLLAAIKA